MTMNRWFRTNNRQFELVIYDFLTKYLSRRSHGQSGLWKNNESIHSYSVKMKTRIEHKIHAIADVLFRDMKDGKLDNEGVGCWPDRPALLSSANTICKCFPIRRKRKF